MVLPALNQCRFYLLVFLLSLLSFYTLASDTTRVKKVRIYPFPAIGYAPETRWYFGGVVLFNMRFNRDTLLRTSTFETEINFTQNKQLIISAGFDLQFFKNKFRWIGDNGYYKFPEDYWGIGNQTSDQIKVRYNATRTELDNSFLIKFKRIYYAGIRQRYHQIKLKETIPFTDLPSAGNVIHASGIGPRLMIDSRDNTLNATKGIYLSLNYQWYFSLLGSDSRFSKSEFDFRIYRKIHKNGVAAFQSVAGFAEGKIPFRMLPMLGSESIMRGYYQGRYRSDAFYAVQGEYRLTVWRWLGGAIFGGAGKVTEVNENGFVLHPTYGAGLRIRIDKKENVNLRFDYARGDYSDGFYVSFGEAF